ncbi:hypothetical protein K9N68_08650 [Kovacikia minuta CCNUW1]|uniref:hypothetical protein n=1 Tax=Kovacikia minuta TaxID=2931930 RepID=UPI001CCBBAD5|nr:hypothetical protein [Kovacikia minuta]UBF27950.1 hypothetical protein K9N68_08650 [Kovacikia minuta CCNUW1]
MQRSISTLLTMLLASTVILPAAYAQSPGTTQSLNPYVTNSSVVDQSSPFNLAYLAYQGYLKDEGIPSNGALIDAIADGTITAQDIMQAAVKANRLSEQTLNNSGYRSSLEDQLKGLTED